MNIIENRYSNKLWLRSAGNGILFEEAPEATFENKKSVNDNKVELVGEDDDDDDDDRREGRIPPKAIDSRGIRIDAVQKANSWLDDYDGARKLNYCQFFI